MTNFDPADATQLIVEVVPMILYTFSVIIFIIITYEDILFYFSLKRCDSENLIKFFGFTMK